MTSREPIGEALLIFGEELVMLRDAHNRLTGMGYELTDEDGEEHPVAWWEERPSSWAYALEAQAEAAARTWDANANTLGKIGRRIEKNRWRLEDNGWQ